jgi:hypothetical protein
VKQNRVYYYHHQNETMSVVDDERERVFRRLLASMPVNHAAPADSSANNDAQLTIDALRFDFPQLSQRGVDALAAHCLAATFAERQRDLRLSPQLLERIDSAGVGAGNCNVDRLRLVLLVHAVRPLLALPREQASRQLDAFVMPVRSESPPPAVASGGDVAPLELIAAEQDGDDYVFEDYDDASSSSSSSSRGDSAAVATAAVDHVALWSERLRLFAQHITYERIATVWSDHACSAVFDALAAVLAQCDDDAALDVLLPRLCFIVRDHCLLQYSGDEMSRLLQLLLDAPAPRKAALAERCAHLAIALLTSLTAIRDASVARYALERLPFLATRAAVPGVHTTQLTSLARIVVHGVALDDRVGAALLPSRFVHSYLRFFLDTVEQGDATTQLTLRGAWPRADADALECEALLLMAAHVPKVLDFLLAVPELAARVASAAFAARHGAWFGAWLVLRAWHAKRVGGSSASVDALIKQLDAGVLAPLSVDAPLEAARVFEWQAALKRIALEQSQIATAYWCDVAARHANRLQPHIGARLAATLDEARERGALLRLQRAVKGVARDGPQKKD